MPRGIHSSAKWQCQPHAALLRSRAAPRLVSPRWLPPGARVQRSTAACQAEEELLGLCRSGLVDVHMLALLRLRLSVTVLCGFMLCGFMLTAVNDKLLFVQRGSPMGAGLI